MELFDVLTTNIQPEQEATDAPRKTRHHFRVSEIASCFRRVFYSRGGYPSTNPFDWQSRLRMDMGTHLHPFVLDRIVGRNQRQIQVLRSEYPLERVFTVGGTRVELHCRPDALVRWRGEPTLLEIKTTSEYGLKATRRNFGDPAHYSWGYLLQAMMAAYMEKPKIPWCMIVVICHGDLQPFEMERDDALMREKLEDLANLERSIQDGEPPDRPYSKDSWNCRGCTYRDLCWGDLDTKSLNAKGKLEEDRSAA